MSDELTQAPRIDGEFWVLADGRRLPRLRGAEEVAVDAAEDTPAEDAAPDGTPAPDSEYTPERARGLHAELTKAQQQLAEVNNQKALWTRAQQGDLDAMRELQLPVQFEDDTEPEEDENAFRDPRLDQLLQEREQERQAKQQEEGWTRFNSDLDQVAKGKKLSDDDRLVIYTKTLQAGSTPDALAQAYDAFAKERTAYDQSVIDAFLESKRAPHVSPGGTGATKTPFRADMSLDERIAAAQEQARLISEHVSPRRSRRVVA
jgi:hypothetical protein